MHFDIYDQTLTPEETTNDLLSDQLDKTTIATDVDQIRDCVFSPDGPVLVLSHQDVILHSHPSLDVKYELYLKEGVDRSAFSLRVRFDAPWSNALFSMDSKKVYCGSLEELVWCWDTDSGRALSCVPAHQGEMFSLAISPDGKLLASCGEDGRLKTWEL